MANGCSKDVPVEVVSDPELIARAPFLGVVVEDALNELGHVFLLDKADTAAAPAGTCQARAEGASFSAEANDFIEVRARTIIQLITALVACVHEGAQLGDFVFLA